MLTQMWKTKNNKMPKTAFTTEETKEKALNLLEYRAHSRKELFDKLRRFTDEETAENVTAMMDEAGLIDDEAYAFQYVRDLIEMKFWGPARLRRELASKGIDDGITEDAIWAAEKELGSPEERLAKLIGIKYKNCLSDEKNRAKTINALFRLGYGYDMIKEAIYNVKEETGDELYGE